MWKRFYFWLSLLTCLEYIEYLKRYVTQLEELIAFHRHYMELPVNKDARSLKADHKTREKNLAKGNKELLKWQGCFEWVPGILGSC